MNVKLGRDGATADSRTAASAARRTAGGGRFLLPSGRGGVAASRTEAKASSTKAACKLAAALPSLLLLSVAFLGLSGCTSTRGGEDDRLSALDEAQERMEKIETEEQDFDAPPQAGGRGRRDANGVPVIVTAMPTLRFSGRGVKVEFENMLLTSFTLLADAKASAGYAVGFTDASSRAEFSITLPVGRYECMLSEKASDAAHAAVSVSIGGNDYEIYPSDPPLGIWELTTRVPIYFDVTEEKPYSVSISSADAGMSLDYIQFVKME